VTRTLWFLFFPLLVLLAGCGYHRPGVGDNLGEVRTLRIPLFANETYEPYLENELTNAITERFLRTRRWRLVETPDAADAVFSGTVSSYRSVPVSFDRNDNILEYRSEMTVSAVLRSSDEGRVLWKGKASWSEEYPGLLDKGRQEDQETEAIRAIAERIAEELYFRLADNF